MLRRKRTIHKWSQKGRIVLCLLQKAYERKFVAPIWSYIFKTQLQLEGLTTGMPATRLDGQYAEMRTGGKGHELYTSIKDASQDVIDKSYGTHLHEIRDAIQVLKLDVKRKKPPAPTTSARAKVGFTGRLNKAASVPATEESDSSPEPIQPRPQLQRFAFTGSPYFAKDVTDHNPVSTTSDYTREMSHSPVSPSLRIDTDVNDHSTDRHPQLLFRATPTVASFRSRRYTNLNKAIPPPYPEGSEEMKDIVWPHLERDKSYISPFISFRENAKTALNLVRTKRSEEIEKKMFLVIFDFNQVQADAAKRFGDKSGPYLVRTLFEDDELSLLPGEYKGTGEVSV